MGMINALDAREIAWERILEIEHESGLKLELLDHSTLQIEQGWVFFYNSADFIRTGDVSDALAGNGPLLITPEGELIELPSSKPWQQALAELR